MAITDLDEQLLVRAHQAGDELAFGQIVRSQHRALYAHAYRRLGSHEAAEDAVQDTLLRAYRAIPSFDGDLRLRAWLHRILTNVCHDEGNRRRRQVGLIDRLEAQPVELAADPVDEAIVHDTVRVMNAALADLPETYREALVLRYVDGLSFREVAEVTGVSEENARARVHRGRVALHKILSRASLMIAFAIPGLRRTHAAPTDAAPAVGSAEPSIHLVTQLSNQAMTAAPTISRVAEVAAATSGTKSSMIAAAVAAVAAVAAPVAAYRVYDAPPSPAPTAEIAGPADDEPDLTAAGTTVTTVVASTADALDAVTTTITTATTIDPTTTTIVAPGRRPTFSAPAGEPETTTSTTAAPAPTRRGTMVGDALRATPAGPRIELDGVVTIATDGGSPSVQLTGKLYIEESQDGKDEQRRTEADFVLTAADGTTLQLAINGLLTEEVADGGATTYRFDGLYRLPGGATLGMTEQGTFAASLRYVADGLSGLSITFEGTDSAQT